MPVPHFKSLMLPCLMALKDGEEVPIAELRNRVASAEGLTADDRQETIPSGNSRFSIHVGWALTHMAHAGLLERTKRGIHRLTPEGGRVLSQTPSRIDVKMLREYPNYAEWSKRKRSSASDETTVPRETIEPTGTPEELIARSVRKLRDALEAEVLERVRAA